MISHTLLVKLQQRPADLLMLSGVVRLSVCLSVCPSVCVPSVDMNLSMHVVGNGFIDFFENVYTNYLSSEDVHQEFLYWLDHFCPFYKLFSVFGYFFITRNSFIKIVKYFDKNIENVLF